MDAIVVYAILNKKVKNLQQYATTGMNYKGNVTSLTQAPTSTSNGDLYISDVEGILTNFGNVSVTYGDGLVYNSATSKWDVIAYSSLVELKSDYLIVDKYSDLVSPQSKNKVAYVLNDEKISGVDYLKGFYFYDKSQTTPKWTYIKMGSGDFSLEKWMPNVEYKVDDYVVYDYKIYKCLLNNTSSTNFKTDLALGDWELFVGGSDFELEKWKDTTNYKIDDYVVYDYKIYKCLIAHTSSTDFENDLKLGNWELYVGNDGLEFRIWASGENYLEKEYVVYDNKLYQANQDITGDINFDKTKYDLIIGKENRYQPWESGKSYVVGDKVEHDSRYYECIVDHTATIFDDDKDNWIEILEIYYSLKQAQYDDMVANGLITDDNKHLYVIEDGVGESSSYEENITTPTDPWIIQHNLKAPYYKLDITCLDNDGDFVYGEVDTTLSTQNLLVINFGTAIAGKVYLTIK